MRHEVRKLLFLIISMTPFALAIGQTGYSARSMGMAGAYQGMAAGADAPFWNPANLAMPGSPRLSVDLLNFGISVGNNRFDLSLINEYFSKSYFATHDMWDDQAKKAIVGEISEDGIRLFNRMHATALAFSFDKYAVAINAFAYVDVKLPEELVKIPLQGLGQEQEDLTDVDGEAIFGTEITFSGAQAFKLNTEWLDTIRVGGTFKYLTGYNYAVLNDAGGTILSNSDSIAIEGTYKLYHVNPSDDKGSTGHGVGIDLGAAAVINENLSVGFSIHNVFGSIKFKGREEYWGSYSFHEPGLNQDEFDNLGSYFDSSATEQFTSNRKTTYTLPKSFLLSGTYRINPQVIVEMDYHQGLNNVAGGTTKPRLSAGTELRYLKWLPTRFGIGLGGIQGSTLAFGLGADLGAYQLDFGIAGQRGLFNHSNGINFAMSQRLVF